MTLIQHVANQYPTCVQLNLILHSIETLPERRNLSRVGQSLIALSLFRPSLFALSLFTKRANRSFALLKRATKSDSLFRSLPKERKSAHKSELLFFYFFTLLKERSLFNHSF